MNPELMCLYQDFQESYGDDMKAWPEAAQEEFYRVRKATFQYDQKLASASSSKEAEED